MRGSLAESFRRFAERFVEHLPNFLAAAVFLVLAVVAARLVRRAVEAALQRTSTEAYVHLLVAKLAWFGTLTLGTVVALSIGGVDLGVLVGSLGLATVALGFALQDIVSNFVAGIVLLLEHPFTRDDYIVTEDAQGTVEDIRVRATQLRTPDGQRVLVPNKLLFTNVLTNASATSGRRLEVRLAVPYGQDAGRAGQALLAAVDEVEGVRQEPPPRLLTEDLGDDAVHLRLWFWVDPRAADPAGVRSVVVEAAAAALRAAGVDLTPPRPTGS